ncbi:zinc D-Ala-D-Ala carboxypeptidase [Azospirillaceae bacterium]
MTHWFRLFGLMIGGAILLSGCASTPIPTASTESRSIVLQHAHTNEVLASTFWRNQNYDQKAMIDISYFLRDRRVDQVMPIDPKLISLLADLRDSLGLPQDYALLVTSGYRSPITNAALRRDNPNVAEHSYHIRGQAMDLKIPGFTPAQVADAAKRLGQGGYAWYPHSQHVHVDTGPVRTWRPR